MCDFRRLWFLFDYLPNTRHRIRLVEWRTFSFFSSLSRHGDSVPSRHVHSASAQWIRTTRSCRILFPKTNHGPPTPRTDCISAGATRIPTSRVEQSHGNLKVHISNTSVSPRRGEHVSRAATSLRRPQPVYGVRAKTSARRLNTVITLYKTRGEYYSCTSHAHFYLHNNTLYTHARARACSHISARVCVCVLCARVCNITSHVIYAAV